MTTDHLYCVETKKSPARFAADFKDVAGRQGFIVANESHMDMARAFRDHGAAVDESFDLHMLQVCKPDKAAGSLQANPERAILMPKFVMVFSDEQATKVRFHHYCRETIASLVDCPTFPDSLAETYQKIIAMIEEAAACSEFSTAPEDFTPDSRQGVSV